MTNPYDVTAVWSGPRHIEIGREGQCDICLTIPEAVELRDRLSAMLAKADLIVALEMAKRPLTADERAYARACRLTPAHRQPIRTSAVSA